MIHTSCKIEMLLDFLPCFVSEAHIGIANTHIYMAFLLIWLMTTWRLQKAPSSKVNATVIQEKSTSDLELGKTYTKRILAINKARGFLGMLRCIVCALEM
jgi:hypothetical protein